MLVTASKKSSSSRKVYQPPRPTKKQVAKIPLTEDEHQRLILPPWECIKRFKTGEQTPTDWYVMSFRILMGRHVANMLYTQEVQKELDLAYQVTLEMLALYDLGNGYNWSATPAQIVTFENALDIVDSIQRDADRATLMFCTKLSYREMLPYAK
jgi:hypothetical protein